MQWLKDNAVGLLLVLIAVGGSYGAFSMKVSTNSMVNVQQNVDIEKMELRLLAGSTTLQATIIRLTGVESQQKLLSDQNLRMINALDKIDVIYNKLVVGQAVQDERILSLSNK